MGNSANNDPPKTRHLLSAAISRAGPITQPLHKASRYERVQDPDGLVLAESGSPGDFRTGHSPSLGDGVPHRFLGSRQIDLLDYGERHRHGPRAYRECGACRRALVRIPDPHDAGPEFLHHVEPEKHPRKGRVAQYRDMASKVVCGFPPRR